MALEKKLETYMMSNFDYLAPLLRKIVSIHCHQFETMSWFDYMQFEVEIVGRIDKTL